MPLIDYPDPDRFVAGTVGPPGQRAFFLQARQGERVTSVSLEKAQVAVLAERIEELLDDMDLTQDVPAAPVDNDPLSVPIEDEFRVSTLSLAWDAGRGVVVIEALDSEVDVEPGPDAELVEVVDPAATTLRVALSPSMAREFARRSLAAVAAGRPPCPFCAEPLDPSGHICPRANGYKR